MHRAAPERYSWRDPNFLAGAMNDLIDVILRLAGGFYALVAFLALRRLATALVIDEAIAALSSTSEQTRADSAARLAAQRLHAALMLGALVVSGLAGLALALMLDLAAALLAAALLVFAGLLIALPLYFDRFDPPPPGARRRSWIAMLAMCGVFLLVIGHWRAGRMIPFAHAQARIVATFFVGAAAFLAAAAWSWRGASGTPRLPDLAPPDSAPTSPETEFAAFDVRRFVLRLTSGGTGLIDADNDESVPFHYPLRELTDADRAALEAWQDDFQRALDPDDPARARIADAEVRAALAARGQELFARLSERFGARLSHEPEPKPLAPSQTAKRLILRAQTRDWPLVDAARPDESHTPESFGLSARLSDDLFDWLMDYDQADFPAERPPGPYDTPDWTEAQIVAFDARGRALAVRVARQLADTGRGDTRVAFTTIAGADVAVDRGEG